MQYPKTWLLCASFGCSMLLLANTSQPSDPTFDIDDDTPLWDVMSKLGKIKTNTLDTSRLYNLEKGRELAEKGFTMDFTGKKTQKLGRLPCLACHTIEPEFDSLQVIDPQRRLLFADSTNRPFLPGTPFYGMVNRVYFFTEDYQSKYKSEAFSDIIKKGHSDLRSAIEACNYVYAQGREMSGWEIESIVAYLWSLQIKMGDLRMPDNDLYYVIQSLETNVGNSKAVNLLRRYYPEVYPATLVQPKAIEDRKKTSPVLNNFANGRRIYEKSCLHCHNAGRYAGFRLDNRHSTFRMLKKHFDDPTSRQSIYDVLRYNPESKGNKTGSPHYTKQRMSDAQIQDLRFYIIEMERFGEEAYEYYKNKK